MNWKEIRSQLKSFTSLAYTDSKHLAVASTQVSTMVAARVAVEALDKTAIASNWIAIKAENGAAYVQDSIISKKLRTARG